MPSLLSSYVAANYGKMTPQQTYGIGEPFTNFGTRQLQVIKVAVASGSNDMRYADGATNTTSYADALSLFSKSVRALQQFVEVYAVYPPVAGGFIAIVALDTGNSAASGEAKTPAPGAIGTSWDQAEAAINGALNASAAATITSISLTPGVSL